jgi:HEPN domain-containing protein
MGRESRRDWLTAQREYWARKAPNYDAACFHAPQVVEKYLKAVFEGYAVQFRYPGISAEKSEAKAALLACERVRS